LHGTKDTGTVFADQQWPSAILSQALLGNTCKGKLSFLPWSHILLMYVLKIRRSWAKHTDDHSVHLQSSIQHEDLFVHKDLSVTSR